MADIFKANFMQKIINIFRKRSVSKEVKKKKENEEEILRVFSMQISLLEEKMVKLINEKVKESADKFQAVDQRFERMLEEVAKANNNDKLASLEAAINVLRKDLNAHQNKMFGVEELMPQFQDVQKEMMRHDAQLKEAHMEMKKLPELQKAADENKKNVADLQAKMPKFQDEIAEKLKNLKERFNESDLKNKDVWKQAGNDLEAVKRQLEKELEALMQRQAPFKEKMDGMAQRVEQVDKQLKQKMQEVHDENMQKVQPLVERFNDFVEKHKMEHRKVCDRIEETANLAKKCEVLGKKIETLAANLKDLRVGVEGKE